jgi:hypothetical protein
MCCGAQGVCVTPCRLKCTVPNGGWAGARHAIGLDPVTGVQTTLLEAEHVVPVCALACRVIVIFASY